jgi:hypothetical protein
MNLPHLGCRIIESTSLKPFGNSGEDPARLIGPSEAASNPRRTLNIYLEVFLS